MASMQELIDSTLDLADQVDPKIGKHCDGYPGPDTLGIWDTHEVADWVLDLHEAIAESLTEREVTDGSI